MVVVEVVVVDVVVVVTDVVVVELAPDVMEVERKGMQKTVKIKKSFFEFITGSAWENIKATLFYICLVQAMNFGNVFFSIDFKNR